jgi:hypothetical protein
MFPLLDDRTRHLDPLGTTSASRSGSISSDRGYSRHVHQVVDEPHDMSP